MLKICYTCLCTVYVRFLHIYSSSLYRLIYNNPMEFFRNLVASLAGILYGTNCIILVVCLNISLNIDQDVQTYSTTVLYIPGKLW